MSILSLKYRRNGSDSAYPLDMEVLGGIPRVSSYREHQKVKRNTPNASQLNRNSIQSRQNLGHVSDVSGKTESDADLLDVPHSH